MDSGSGALTVVGLVGLALGLLAWPFAYLNGSRLRIAVFLLAYLVHVGTAIVYYQWVQTNTADTILYYFDPFEMYREPLRPGTLFVVHLVQSLKGVLGGSYLDYFLFFQAFGFWGIVLLMRTFEEIHLELSVEQRAFLFLLLFLPGVNFWTSAIGKDAPLFFAASLAVWSSMQLARRWPGFGIAVFVMVLFRPHIALLAVVALAITAFFDPRARGYVKFGLVMLALGGVVIVAGTVQSSFQVDVTSAGSVGEFLDRQSEVTQKIGGGSAVTGALYPVRLFSLLFRPLFIDAEGLFGLIASAENVVIAIVVFTLIRFWRDTLRLARQVFFLRFAIVFSGFLILLLALVYYNVGLGLRQKQMFMPGLLTMFAALIASRQIRRASATLSYA